MEIHSHRQHHYKLHRCRYDQQLEKLATKSRRLSPAAMWQPSLASTAKSDLALAAGPDAIGRAWARAGLIFDRIKVGERPFTPPSAAVEEGRANARNRGNRQEAHLKTGIKERARIHCQQTQRRQRDRVQRAPIAVEQPPHDIGPQRECGSHNRGSQVGEQREQSCYHQSDRAATDFAATKAPHKPEHRPSQYSHVQSGDHEDVIHPSALKLRARGTIEQ
jgi:hypothetical protein